MKTVIVAENLSKKYMIRHENTARYTTLMESLSQVGRRLSTWSHAAQPKVEEFWAIRDINFEIKQGDRVGIIGRNGAGKSTLLKLLSRITEPTEGKIGIKGRVASLMEVGTGFHPELTGRENIFLNGAILGMSRRDIQSKFDEIVWFSEVEKFLDTPVKRYSSGMYVRLAFAVAAHLEPEILIIDEVLAVGDAQFQKKCLGKMGTISNEGRTLLFVSHNMNAVEQLCNKAMLLGNGSIAFQSDNSRDVITHYLGKSENEETSTCWKNVDNSLSNQYFRPTFFGILPQSKDSTSTLLSNDKSIDIIIEGETQSLDKALQIGFAIYNDENHLLFWSIFNDCAESDWPVVNVGTNRLKVSIPARFLNEGIYRLELIVALYFRAWLVEPQKNSPSIFIKIQGGLSNSPYWITRRPGILAPELSWSIE